MTATKASMGRWDPAWPYQPLEKYLAATRPTTDGPVTAREVAKLAGVTRTTVQKWRATGVFPEVFADRAAIAAGAHPAEIWPDWFDRVA